MQRFVAFSLKSYLVIKELIVKPPLKDKAGKDIQIQRLYMLYKAMFEGKI